LLATVIVQPGTSFTGNPLAYVRKSLADANPQLPSGVRQALLQSGDLTPWSPMEDLKDAHVTSKVQSVDFFIGSMPAPPASEVTVTCNPGAEAKGPFGFYINYKSYDPDRIDFTRQVNTVDDWQLTSQVEPHIFHIHVNPFEVMDVIDRTTGKSIFDANGVCTVPADGLGLENQYCGMWHTFKDTVFVQNKYKVLVRTRYDRYIGEFVIHCHILDHEDGGMMTNIQIVPNASAPGGGVGMSHASTTSMKMNHN